MDLIEALIEFQINYQVYNRLYNCDRQTILVHLKRTILYLELIDLSVKTIICIIDGIVNHPVNRELKQPDKTNLSDIGKTMLSLRQIIFIEYKKRGGDTRKRKYKKFNPAIVRIREQDLDVA